jgi:hypothetical protein
MPSLTPSQGMSWKVSGRHPVRKRTPPGFASDTKINAYHALSRPCALRGGWTYLRASKHRRVVRPWSYVIPHDQPGAVPRRAAARAQHHLPKGDRGLPTEDAEATSTCSLTPRRSSARAAHSRDRRSQHPPDRWVFSSFRDHCTVLCTTPSGLCDDNNMSVRFTQDAHLLISHKARPALLSPPPFAP